MEQIDNDLPEIKRKIKEVVGVAPKERCGVGVLVLKKGSKPEIEIREVENISDIPGVCYIMSPSDLGDKTDDTTFFRKSESSPPLNEVLFIWHTHPTYPSDPSPIDITHMFLNKWYVIYSQSEDTLTAFYKART